jgi:hypothetical protein
VDLPGIGEYWGVGLYDVYPDPSANLMTVDSVHHVTDDDVVLPVVLMATLPQHCGQLRPVTEAAEKHVGQEFSAAAKDRCVAASER